MSAASQLLVELSQRGIAVWADGDRLRFRPRSAVDPGLLEKLRAAKTEILAKLESEARELPIVQSQVVVRSATGVEVVKLRRVNPPGPIRWEKRLSSGGVVSLVGDSTTDPGTAASWIKALQAFSGTVLDP